MMSGGTCIIRALGPLLAASVLAAGCLGDEGRSRNYDGPWVRHAIDDTGRGADGVRVADVNGDGLPDVVTGWEEDGVTRAYLHPGHARATEPWPAVTVGRTPHVEDAVFADVDGDGRLDVVSSCEGDERQVFVSFAPADPDRFLDGAAWRTEAIPAAAGRRWMFALPLDVNRDGRMDLVVGGKRGDAIVGWLESPADGDPADLAAWTLHEMSPAGWVMSMEAVDMDGDGLEDLLVSDRLDAPVHGVRWLRNPGDDGALRSAWEAHWVGARKRSPVFAATVPGVDGRPRSVVVPSGMARLTRFDREDEAGVRWSEHELPFPRRLGTPKSAAVGDVDLDGELDVVLACTNLDGHDDGIVWLAGGAERGVDEPDAFELSGEQGQKFDRMELLDLDGDGDLDVLTTEEIEQFGVVWYANPLFQPGEPASH